MNKIIAFLYLACAAVMLHPSIASAQTGWSSIYAPIGFLDFDVANDSVIAVFYENSTALSADGGAHWVTHHTAPFKTGLHLRSMKAISASTIKLFGCRDDVTRGYNQLVISTSTDTGKTWDTPDGGIVFGSTLQLVEHSVNPWYYGTFPGPQGWGFYGAIGVAEGATHKGVWKNGDPVLDKIDLRDSIGMAIATDYHQLLFVTHDSGGSWTQNAYHLRDDDGLNPGSVRHSTSNLWFLSDTSALEVSRDNGATWTLLENFPWFIRDFRFEDSIGYLVFNGQDHIEKTTDGGLTWFGQTCYSSDSHGLYPVASVIPTVGSGAYALSGGAILKTEDGGGRPGPVMNFARVIDFGAVLHGRIASAQATIKNVGLDTLIVSGVVADLSNVTVNPSTFTLAPGAATSVTINYTPISAAGDYIAARFLTNTISKKEIFFAMGKDSVLASVPIYTKTPETLDVRLSANPWSTATTIQLDKPAGSLATIRITDQLGREYFNRSTTNKTISLSANDFVAGVYMLFVSDAAGARKMLKFVKM